MDGLKREIERGRIPNKPIAEAVLKWRKETGNSYYKLYDILGWSHCTGKTAASYLPRILGLAKQNKSCCNRKTITPQRAAEIIRAIDREPWEFDI